MSEIEPTPPVKDIEERGFFTAREVSAFLQEAREKGIEVTELLKGEGFSETLVESVRDIKESENKLHAHGQQLRETIWEQEQAYSKFSKANEAFLEDDNMKPPEGGLLNDGQELPFSLMMPHALPEPQVQQPPPHRIQIPKGGTLCHTLEISVGTHEQIKRMIDNFLTQPGCLFTTQFFEQDGDFFWFLHIKNPGKNSGARARHGYVRSINFPIAQVHFWSLFHDNEKQIRLLAKKIEVGMRQFGFQSVGKDLLNRLERGIVDILTKDPIESGRLTDEDISRELANRGIFNSRGIAYTREHVCRIKNDLMKRGII